MYSGASHFLTARAARNLAFWGALALLLCAAGSAAAATPQLPDLVADPPVSGNAPIVYTDAQGSRLLLRMDGFVHNRGAGALEVRGSDPVDGVMTKVRQRVYDDQGGYTDITHSPEPSLIYETNDDHRHFHLFHAMRYSLWSADRTMEVAPVQKVGFCLLDSEPVEASPSATPTYTEEANDFCQADHPDAPTVFEGVSAGWRDLYPYVLAFQWVDISDVAPGYYWLRSDADPDNVIAESDEHNVGAYDHDLSIVNGYRADPVAAGTVDPLAPTTISLQATEFDDVHLGHPGERQFQVVTPPVGGTLDQPAGTWFSASTLQYTPRPGFTGPDTFTVTARDASSPYPLHPPGAAVTLTVPATGPSPTPTPLATGTATATPTATPAIEPGVLGISGAPALVYTSSQTQLSASGPGVDQGVTWSTRGGGRVSQAGLLYAPKTVPAGGSVTVVARSASGAAGQVTIGIDPAVVPRPAPTLKPPPVPEHGLSRIKLQSHANTVIAIVSSAQTGRVRFVGRSQGARFGSCTTMVRRGGAATCRMRLKGVTARSSLFCRISRTIEAALPAITVRAQLARHGRVVARRHATLR